MHTCMHAAKTSHMSIDYNTNISTGGIEGGIDFVVLLFFNRFKIINRVTAN